MCNRKFQLPAIVKNEYELGKKKKEKFHDNVI